MTTGGVKSLRNVWGDGVGLFLCGWEAVENAKMERMAVHISTIRRPRTKKNAGPNSKPRYIMQNHRRRSAAEVKWEIPVKGLYRIRSGNYRIIYQVDDQRLIVLVVKIGDRKDVYD